MASGDARSTARIRVRQTFLEAFDLKLRTAKRGKAQRQRPGPASNDIMARQRIEIVIERKFDKLLHDHHHIPNATTSAAKRS